MASLKTHRNAVVTGVQFGVSSPTQIVCGVECVVLFLLLLL
jgi:hypothetical protein